MRPLSDAALLNALCQDNSPKRIAIRSDFASTYEHGEYRALMPFSGGVWEMEAAKVGRMDWQVERCLLLLEYPTLFGRAALLRVSADEPTLGPIRNNIIDLKKFIAIYEDRRAEELKRSAATRV